ncbi:Fic family protein [Cryobacterium sp. Y62]|uniref:Fic/DOC family protein n=1 Tax=Cryobacterium sp. Y62 TaxID=2048284 RepID=UPI000CE52E9A|nr:Fic family protein [Cryobacterium sp. Y62]
MPADSLEHKWDAYLWEPGGRVLRNKLGEHDYAELARREHKETFKQSQKIRDGRIEIPRTFDADHLRAIHKAQFSGIFEWAGEYRTVPIFKGTPGGFAEVKQIDRYLGDVRRIIAATPWESVDRDQFAAAAANVFAYVNQAHPFREGNGRASKLFMEHVADRSQFSIDYTRVAPDRWNEASKYSGPNLGEYRPVPDTLVPVFYELAQPRGSVPMRPQTSSELRLALYRSESARSPTEAVKKAPADAGRAHRSSHDTRRGNSFERGD